jgi:hypothetical protein
MAKQVDVDGSIGHRLQIMNCFRGSFRAWIVQVIQPSPPPAHTEAANSTVPKPAMGARIIGCSIFKSSIRRRCGHIAVSHTSVPPKGEISAAHNAL